MAIAWQCFTEEPKVSRNHVYLFNLLHWLSPTCLMRSSQLDKNEFAKLAGYTNVNSGVNAFRAIKDKLGWTITKGKRSVGSTEPSTPTSGKKGGNAKKVLVEVEIPVNSGDDEFDDEDAEMGAGAEKSVVKREVKDEEDGVDV